MISLPHFYQENDHIKTETSNTSESNKEEESNNIDKRNVWSKMI